MKEISSSDLYNINIINNNISDLKIFPTAFSTEQISKYNSKTLNKEDNSSNINNNIIFKITEKECSVINTIVKSSVEKINNLLNSKELNKNNFSKTFKRPSKYYILEVLDKEKEKK